MGTKDLHTQFIGRSRHEYKNQKPQQRLANLDAGTIGVDISTLLYPCLRTPNGSAVFDIDGPKSAALPRIPGSHKENQQSDSKT
eukprot:scaffold9371_cov66-Cyclotella_meneghiniana.AAC.2